MTNTFKGAATAVLLAAVACGDNESPVPTTGAAPDMGMTPGVMPACDALVGLPTDEVVEGTCDDNGTTHLMITFSYECPDGRTLSWNDYGWGYSGDVWQAHARADGQLVPPDADMAACNQ